MVTFNNVYFADSIRLVTLLQFTGTLEQDILYNHSFTAGFFAPEKSDDQS